jgi:hypothetical protein
MVMMRVSRILVVMTLWLVSVISPACWPFEQQGRKSENSSDALPYNILDDQMGTIIRIGVISTITENELRATLVKSADEHQDDPARDYLTSRFLMVEAYLVKNGSQSSIAAGTLRRYVPPGNPAERSKLTNDRSKYDTFTISIDEASRSLK